MLTTPPNTGNWEGVVQRSGLLRAARVAGLSVGLAALAMVASCSSSDSADQASSTSTTEAPTSTAGGTGADTATTTTTTAKSSSQPSEVCAELDKALDALGFTGTEHSMPAPVTVPIAEPPLDGIECQVNRSTPQGALDLDATILANVGSAEFEGLVATDGTDDPEQLSGVGDAAAYGVHRGEGTDGAQSGTYLVALGSERLVKLVNHTPTAMPKERLIQLGSALVTAS